VGLFSNWAPDPDGYKYNEDGTAKTKDEIVADLKEQCKDIGFTEINRANWREAKKLGLIDKDTSYQDFVDAHDTRDTGGSATISEDDFQAEIDAL
jgi:hypothetical protein